MNLPESREGAIKVVLTARDTDDRLAVKPDVPFDADSAGSETVIAVDACCLVPMRSQPQRFARAYEFRRHNEAAFAHRLGVGEHVGRGHPEQRGVRFGDGVHLVAETDGVEHLPGVQVFVRLGRSRRDIHAGPFLPGRATTRRS